MEIMDGIGGMGRSSSSCVVADGGLLCSAAALSRGGVLGRTSAGGSAGCPSLASRSLPSLGCVGEACAGTAREAGATRRGGWGCVGRTRSSQAEFLRRTAPS